MMISSKLILGVFLLLISSSYVWAQSAEDRAGELKLWRENCSHQDIDVRTGYVENAIQKMGPAIKRICVRKSLESTNADIRNLGLRSAIAINDQITFEVKYPEWLKKAYDKAENDDRKLREVNKYYQAQDIPVIINGITFVIQDADILSNTSTWYPLASLSEPSKRYSGKATIRGDKLNWNGNILFNNKQIKCSLSTILIPGPILKGSLNCGKRGSYEVEVNLL